MANSWFKFKKFTVVQDKAAMKVGTDGVLLGAWANVEDCSTILDVGTGTGLISLMAAQRNSKAFITAIDIDADAIEQAQSNFNASDWSPRLSAKHLSLQAFSKTITSAQTFDLVVSNPPFFINAYKSHNHSRNCARHNDSLPYQELIQCARDLTTVSGRLAVIIPYEAEQMFLSLARKCGFYISRLTRIKPTPQKSFVRSLIEVSKKQSIEGCSAQLIIEDKGRHGYSNEYINLTKDFYLAF